MPDTPKLLDEHLVEDLRNAVDPQVLMWVLHDAVGMSFADVARALHVSPGTPSRWYRGESYRKRGPARDLATLARTVAVLAGTLTPKGIRQWLWGANERLGGAVPLFEFDDNPGDVRAAAEFLAGDGVA